MYQKILPESSNLYHRFLYRKIRASAVVTDTIRHFRAYIDTETLYLQIITKSKRVVAASMEEAKAPY